MLQRSTIVIMEDDSAIASMLETILSEVGHHTTRVSNEQSEMLEHMREAADLVLLDSNWACANINGAIDALHIDPTTPIVLITGLGERAAARISAQTGAVATIQKPFDIDELVDVVERSLTYRCEKHRHAEQN